MQLMMTQKTTYMVLGLVVLWALSTSTAAFAAAGNDYWDRKDEGWFFYNERFPKEKEPPEEKPEPEPVPQPDPPKEEKEPVEVEKPKDDGDKLVFLSAEWLRENLPKYRDRAIDNPTQENVAAYAYLQRVAIDKSHRFQEGMEQLIIADARLDENLRRPLSGAGSQLKNHEVKKNVQETLSKLGKVAGIWFFYRSDCSYCERQAPVLKVLETQNNMQIYPVSLDGKALPSGVFPKFKTDNGQAQKLGVMQTPAMFLVKPDTKDFIPLGQSLLSLPEVRERLLIVANKIGLISDTDYSKSKPAATDQRFSQPVVPEDTLGDPDSMVESLRQQLGE